MTKILFLSGCNGQLGLSISKSFSYAGWKVFGIDSGGQTNSHYIYKFIEGSVISRENWRDLFERSLEYIENEADVRICLINNAGIAKFSPSEERTLDEFQDVMSVNVFGPIAGITELYKFIKRIYQKEQHIRTSIINIGSIYGHIAPNGSIYTDTSRNSSEVYGASKAGVSQITRYFAVRYATEDIQVNAIAPGGVINTNLQGSDFISRYSQLVPARRMCFEQEVTEMCHAMLEFPKYLTGQTILLDGGMTSW